MKHLLKAVVHTACNAFVLLVAYASKLAIEVFVSSAHLLDMCLKLLTLGCEKIHLVSLVEDFG